MGKPMAMNLIKGGHHLFLHSRSGVPQELTVAGGTACTSAKEVAQKSDVICTSLPSLEIIREVVLGERGVCRGTNARFFIDFSTTGSEFAAWLAKELSKFGIKMLDSPVTGAVRRAAEGSLALIVSGDKKTFERLRPVLQPLGKAYYVSNKPGAAQILKLINNLLSVVGTAAAYEAFVMGAKAGLDPDIMLEVINNGTGRNDATLNKIPRAVLPRTFDYGNNMDSTYKDINLCMAEAEKLGVTMLLGNMARQLWAYGYHHGGAKKDSSTLITHFEDWAGVKVIGKAARSRRK